jgi:hypothetical protein
MNFLRNLSAFDTNTFKLISLRPYADCDKNGRIYTNMSKQFRYPVTIHRLQDVNVENSVWGKQTIGCADDICFQALQLKYNNIEVKAHGMDITLPEAVLEAARHSDAERFKYILFTHPIHSRVGKPGFILENTAAPSNATEVMVVTLVPSEKN